MLVTCRLNTVSLHVSTFKCKSPVSQQDQPTTNLEMIGPLDRASTPNTHHRIVHHTHVPTMHMDLYSYNHHVTLVV